jgi:hypothetical protein
MSEKDRNLRIAESITTRFAWNEQTFHEGDCVALLDGQIIAVAKTPEAAISALLAREPDPKRGMVIEVAHHTIDVVR